MIKVVTGNTIKRDEPVIISPSTTLRAHLESKGYNTHDGMFSLNGRFVTGAELDKPFSDFDEPTNGTYTLLDVVKARNA